MFCLPLNLDPQSDASWGDQWGPPNRHILCVFSDRRSLASHTVLDATSPVRARPCRRRLVLRTLNAGAQVVSKCFRGGWRPRSANGAFVRG